MREPGVLQALVFLFSLGGRRRGRAGRQMRSSVPTTGGVGVTGMDAKEDLHSYLRGARETLVWKLDGLGEYDIRRPLTPTGTNLLGLVKHSGSTHFRYFGEVFGRTQDESLSWLSGGGEPNADFWAAPDEGRDDILDGCRRAWDLADATISELPMGALGRVPWWGGGTVTLLGVLGTSLRRPNVTPATPTSFGSSSTARPASSRASTTSSSANRLSGPTSVTGSRRRRVWRVAGRTSEQPEPNPRIRRAANAGLGVPEPA
jgi:hypothetical protein